MSRYTGPKLRIVRRLGKLAGFTKKVSNKKNPPGDFKISKKKPSRYSLQLKEKQKLRYNYGITERQLENYIKKSRKGEESSGRFLLTLLDMRLDSIIFRLGFAKSIVASRQIVTHRHILVNNKQIDIPNYQCLRAIYFYVYNYLNPKYL